MAGTRHTLTGTFQHGDGSGRAGRLLFAPTVPVLGDEVIVLPSPLTVNLDATGHFSVELAATDDPAWQPSGWLWQVTEVMDGGRAPWLFELTADADLSSLSVVVPPDDYVTLVPVSRQINAGAGLTGGGNLTADRTLAVDPTLDLADLGSGSATDGYVATADGAGGVAWEIPSGGGGLVDSVNGQTGAVVLDSEDVGAAPEAHGHPAADITDATATGRALVTAADAAAARSAIGASDFDGAYGSLTGLPTLGDAASKNTGTTAGTVASGDDLRLSDARTPTSHQHPAADISDSTATGRAVLNAATQASARGAIGAGTSNFDGAYPSLSSKPTLGTSSPLNVPASGDAASGEVVKGSDSRLTDARTPSAHTHLASAISDATSTGRAVVTAADAATARTAIGAGTSNLGIGTTGTTAAAGNDARLTDARTPTAHTHGLADLTATGVKDDTTFLRGDNTWAAPPDGGGGGVTDHGALTGLGDDDHTQYALADGTRGAFAAPLGTDDNYVTDAEKTALHGHANKTALDAVSGTNTGDQTLPTWTTIADKPAVIAAGVDAATARTAIGAGTSSLVIGTTVSTAKAGNYTPAAASATAQGIVELATPAEAATGTDTVRAVTPQGLKGVADTKAATAHTHAPADVTGTAVVTSDPRLSDARTPTTHRTSHATGGGDVLTPADIGAATAAQGALAATASQPGHGHTLDAVTDTATRLALTPAERTKIGNTSGTNTGDQALPTWTTIAGKPAVVAAGIDAPAARGAIGAGTSNFDGAYPSLSSKPTLGDAAAKDTGTAAGTVAAGDDSRFSYVPHVARWNGTGWRYRGTTITVRPSGISAWPDGDMLWDTSQHAAVTTPPALAIVGDKWLPHGSVTPSV